MCYEFFSTRFCEKILFKNFIVFVSLLSGRPMYIMTVEECYMILDCYVHAQHV